MDPLERALIYESEGVESTFLECLIYANGPIIWRAQPTTMT